MGLFSRKPLVVQVSYRDLAAPGPESFDRFSGYAFIWNLKEKPSLGLRVIVPGGDGRQASGMVVGFGLPPSARGLRLSAVIRVATQAEIQKALQDEATDKVTWLNMARRAVGLPVSGRARKKVPDGFDPVPPAKGDASPQKADQYGRVWWRAWKLAERLGRERDEIEAFREVAFRWFAVRDRGK